MKGRTRAPIPEWRRQRPSADSIITLHQQVGILLVLIGSVTLIVAGLVLRVLGEPRAGLLLIAAGVAAGLVTNAGLLVHKRRLQQCRRRSSQS